MITGEELYDEYSESAWEVMGVKSKYFLKTWDKMNDMEKQVCDDLAGKLDE